MNNRSCEKQPSLRGFISPHALTGDIPQKAVLVAFSGGPDSRTLLDLLVADARAKGYSLFAAHVNHGIRGQEADRDEEFCRSVATSYGIPLFVHRINVPALAKETGESVETAARNARYSFFSQLMQEHHIPILVTAHNADDNLETVLFDLVRGCGLDGLCGIPPIRPVPNGTLVRPLLACSREEILSYCRTHALDFVTDSTNTDTQYTRNRIRAELVPALRAIHPTALESVTRACQALRVDAEHLRKEAEAFLASNRCDFSLPVQTLREAPPAIASRALMLLFRELTDGVALEQCHVRALLSLTARAVPHASLNLPNGQQAIIENGMLCFQAFRKAPLATAEYCITLDEGRNPISQTNSEIVIGNSQSAKNVYKKEISMYLASDTIVGKIHARNRRAGDRILLHGLHKDVRKLMNEHHIPLEWRDRLPILCDDVGILAIPFVAVRDGAYVAPEHVSPDHHLSIYFVLYE